jgi:hypothetical protein
LTHGFELYQSSYTSSPQSCGTDKNIKTTSAMHLKNQLTDNTLQSWGSTPHRSTPSILFGRLYASSDRKFRQN